MPQTNGITDQSSRKLRALDVDLPSLAIRAALELRMFEAGKGDTLPSLKKLSDLITNSISMTGTTTKSLVDPSTVTIMNRAVIESNWTETKPQSIEDLTKHAVRLADEMKLQSQGKNRNGELEKLKNFCVALSRCASSYRKAVLGPRRKHPNRK